MRRTRRRRYYRPAELAAASSFTSAKDAPSLCLAAITTALASSSQTPACRSKGQNHRGLLGICAMPAGRLDLAAHPLIAGRPPPQLATPSISQLRTVTLRHSSLSSFPIVTEQRATAEPISLGGRRRKCPPGLAGARGSTWLHWQGAMADEPRTQAGAQRLLWQQLVGGTGGATAERVVACPKQSEQRRGAQGHFRHFLEPGPHVRVSNGKNQTDTAGMVWKKKKGNVSSANSSPV